MEDFKATVSPSPARRFMALAMILGLGGLLIYLAFAAPPESFAWQVFLIGVGVLALLGFNRLRLATQYSLVLESDRLVDTSGRELCKFSNIHGVERGAFAFKPSNGFLIRLKEPLPRAWAPGLWWRFGKSVGVGGVTPASEAKFMAELIALRLADT